MTIKTICAWCSRLLKDGPAHPVSHGVCPECFRKVMGEALDAAEQSGEAA
jgi:hypothetical protein